jgi:hypothetical protein
MHPCVWSRNLVNQEALAFWGLSRQIKKKNYPDIIYLRARGCDDPWSFYEAKRDSEQNRLGNTNSDYVAIKAGWPVDSELEWSGRGLIGDEVSLFSEGLKTTTSAQYNVALCDWDLSGSQLCTETFGLP